MSTSVGEIRINLSAGTSQFVQDLEKAKAKVTEFGGHATSEHKAAAAAGKLLEGQMFNNTRAMDSFLVSTLKLGPVVQAAFPVLGALAFAGVIFEAGKKLTEFFKTNSEGASKAATDWNKMTQSIGSANAGLETQAAKLQNEIAKLMGKPQNGLAVALADAREESIKLGESLEKNLEDIGKLLKEHSGNMFEFWKPDTSELQDKINETLPQVYANTAHASDLIKNTKGPNAKQHVDNIITATQGENNRLIDILIEAARKKLTDAQKDLAESILSFRPGSLGAKADQAKPRAEILDASRTVAMLQATKDNQNDQLDVHRLGNKKTDLDEAKANAEALDKALKDGYDRMLQEIETNEPMLASEKIAFRQQELVEIAQDGKKHVQLVKDINAEIAALSQTSFAEGAAAQKKNVEEQRRFMMAAYEAMVEWRKRGYQTDKEQAEGKGEFAQLGNPNKDLHGNDVLDRTKLKPENLGGPVGASAILQKQGFPTISDMQSAIDDNKNLLALAQSINQPLTTQLEIRKRIMEAQLKLNEAQGDNKAANQNQFDLTKLNVQQTMQQWQGLGTGNVANDISQKLLALPAELGNTLANAVFDHKKGDSMGKQFGQLFKGLGKQLFGDIAGMLIEKLTAEIAVHLFGIQVQTAQVTATTANTAALIANTAAQGVSGGASAAGGIASGVGSAASAASSGMSAAATGMMGPLISAAGGVIGGVISGVMSLIGDNRIVKAVNGTTAAVQALGSKMGSGSGLTSSGTATGTSTTPTQVSSGIPFVGGLLQSFLGFGGGSSSKPIPVSIESINPMAPLKGILGLFGFASGTDNAPGGLSWVGENGKELMNVPKGAQIIPNHKTAGYLDSFNGPGMPKAFGTHGATSHMSNAGYRVGGDTHTYNSGSHTFHIHGVTNPADIAKKVAEHLKNSSPRFSPASR